MKKWSYLQPGDLIDIVAPGSPCTREEFKLAVQYLEHKGYRVRYPIDLFSTDVPFHSTSDDKRYEHFHRALMAKDSKAIWCLRGGYGSNRLVPELMKIKLRPRPKVLIGISDITSLHLFLNLQWSWSSIHGPLLDRLGSGRVPPTLERELWNLLTGKSSEQVFASLMPMNAAATKVKKISGTIIGGNLSVVQSALGTSIKLNFKDRILFLEDANERGYRLDKMFFHLRTSQALNGVKGIVFGHFTGGEEPGSKKSLTHYALQRFANEVGIPVFSGIQSGHGAKLRGLPLNTAAELQRKSGSFQLTVQSGGR